MHSLVVRDGDVRVTVDRLVPQVRRSVRGDPDRGIPLALRAAIGNGPNAPGGAVVLGDHGSRLATVEKRYDSATPFVGHIDGSVGRDLEVPVQAIAVRSEEHTSELQSRVDLVCRLLL